MNDVPRFSEVLEGYLDLASQLLNHWTPFLNGVSAQVEAGTYQATDATTGFPAAAKLVADSWMWIGSEAIDALAILTKDFGEQEVVTGYATLSTGTTRTLALKGPLKSVTDKELPAHRVTIVPTTLDPNSTEFALHVNGDGMKARTYDGWVVATPAQGGVAEEVFVSVTIG